MINIITPTDCCGCGACAQRCPKHCITMSEDDEGFVYPRVDTARCIDCGLCEMVCPELHPAAPVRSGRVIAARHRDDAVRCESSSGGVFHALARRVIERGGVVFGVETDEEGMARYAAARRIEQLPALMGSKYMQARGDDEFLRAERALKEGLDVLFTGTPCRIAALHRFLRKDYERLVTVDFFCHGVPSPGVWRSYLEHDVRPAAGERLSVNFRDKRPEGWRRYALTLSVGGRPVLSQTHDRNAYMRGFLGDVYLRPACHACRVKGGASHSDLTLGDYWGVERLQPDIDDDRGMSLVIISSPRGAALLDGLPLEVYPCDAAAALAENIAYSRSVAPHPRRADFFRLWREGGSVSRAVDTVSPLSLKHRIVDSVRRRLRSVIGRKATSAIKKLLRGAR